MNDPRRHHYFAEDFQQRFTDAEGRLFIFDKRRPQVGVRRDTPHNSFVKRDLNAFTETDGTRNTELETWYSQLEGEVKPIIEKIVEAARALQVPSLSEAERNVWDNFFYHQQKRAPDIFHKLGLVETFDQDLEREIAEYERDIRPLTTEEHELLRSPEGKQKIIQNASVQARGHGSEEIVATLAGHGLAMAIITKPTKSFIIGDHPLARMGPDGKLGHPATELWFPIASDVAVSPGGPRGFERLVPVSSDDVRRVNKVVAENSNIIAGRSEALIRSLAGL